MGIRSGQSVHGLSYYSRGSEATSSDACRGKYAYLFVITSFFSHGGRISINILLIQMLCEERGLFLEIADIVRGLGLTILKGVMEARNDKVWACFTVEVLPLVLDLRRLLHSIPWLLLTCLRSLLVLPLSNLHQCTISLKSNTNLGMGGSSVHY